jgi:DNA-binding NarL/FixJ family response regulator
MQDERIVAMGRTVVIVDDHAGFRRFARRLLETEGFVVVGEAADAAEALRQVRALRPTLVLLDVVLPDLDGFAVAELLACEKDEPFVVLTSSREASDYSGRLAVTSARAFLPKHALSGPALTELIEEP